MECRGCSREFIPTTNRQKYCERECQRKSSRNARRSYERRYVADLEFIGVDGEGVNRPDGRHEYVMLSVGDDTLWDGGRELTHREILPWLYDRYLENPDACYVGFFLGYDFLQWTKSLDENEARLLWTEKGIASRKPKRRGFVQSWPVVVDQAWEIDLLAKKRFRLRPHRHTGMKADPFKCHCGGDVEYDLSGELDGEEFDSWDDVENSKPMKKASSGPPWMYVCDTGPFWQTSFLNAVNPKGWPHPVVSEEEYAILREGKGNRAVVYDYGDVSYKREMARYNRLENEVLARVTRALNEGFCSIGVKIPKQSWYGPGQAASIWMKEVSRTAPVPFTREEVNARVPDWAREAARKTYYGGWFEQFVHGHIPGVVWEYDINSAYPYIISRLPCLHHPERWERGEGVPVFDDTRYYIVRARILGSDPFIGALPFRDKHGRILRLHMQEGWYWRHEIEAAVKAGVIDEYEIREWWSYAPCDCPPPMRGIADLYKKRLDVGKNSPEGKALKLLYNSVYGKTAQSVGSPLFGNAIYASLITAGCRTMILEAIATHPEKTRGVTMVATDGVYFRSPHPGLEIDGEKLGAWDVSEKENLTQFMPGLYWDDKVRRILNEETQRGIKAEKLPLKTRGVNVRDLADSVTELDSKFSESIAGYLETYEYDWPTFAVPVRFDIVSCGQALARGKWSTAGTIHGDTHNPSCDETCKKGVKTISSDPASKRVSAGVYLDFDVLRTPVYDMIEGQEESLPYEKNFGGDDGEIINQEGRNLLEWFFQTQGEVIE